MALYEFECLKCGIDFDVRQPMGAEHIADCPECKSTETKRIWSIPKMVVRSSAYMMAKHSAPKSRLENMDKVRDERAERKSNANNEKDKADNSLHVNKKK